VHNFFSPFRLKLKFDGGRPVFPVGRFLPYILCAVLIFATCGCGQNSTSKPLATVNGMTISISEFNNRYARDVNSLRDRSSLTPEDYDHLKEEVLNILIDEKLMLLRAKELSISVSDVELAKKVDEIKESYAFNDGFDKVITTRKVDYGQWKEELRKRIILEKLVSADVNSKVQVKD